MAIRLVDRKWAREFDGALRAGGRELRLISPFIKLATIERLLSRHPKVIQVVTRFNEHDFAQGVSDISALRRLLDAGARVRGVRNLHAKVYLFGTRQVIITSANLTEAALVRNHEFGMVADDREAIAASQKYFDDVWRRSGPNLSSARLAKWDKTVTQHRARNPVKRGGNGLKDHGADLGYPPDPAPPQPAANGIGQGFVKFIGTSSNRADLALDTFDEIKLAGCHWAVSYPPKKRPRSVEDGDMIFIGRIVKPNDIRVFGCATAHKHQPGHDDAVAEDIARRPWRKKWPHYLRLDNARFVSGTMANGVSLNEMMEALGWDSFSATQHNAWTGSGNTEPRRAYQQKAHIRLADQGVAWLTRNLRKAFEEHGAIPPRKMRTLDWPKRL